MNAIFEAIGRFLSSWKPWVIVAPWEGAVRVRLGKRAVSLGSGPHLRIPLLDRILLVNTRLRVTTTAPVTLSGNGGSKVRVRQAIIGYCISNPLLAVEHFNHPQEAVCSIVQGEMASGADSEAVMAKIQDRMEGAGVKIDFVRYCDDVEVRAYRLLQATWSLESTDQKHGDEAVVRY